MARQQQLTGSVTKFDDPAGLGEVTDGNGHTFGFHCTAIADGSRTVEVGTAVRFAVIAGHVGRFEADALVPV